MKRFCVTLLLYVTSGLAGGRAIPLAFERNVGQTDSRARFLAHTNGFQFFLTSSEAVMAIDGTPGTGSSVWMRLAGSNPHPSIQPVDPMAGSANYFMARQRYTNIPRLAAYATRACIRGIDLVYRVQGGDIEFDFVVAPEADPDKIELAFAGDKSLAVDEKGDLLIQTTGGTVRQHRARVYQGSAATGKQIECRYRLADNGRVRLELAAYDRSQALVIDPVLTYTFYSGVTASESPYATDEARGIAVDSAGYIYVTGETAAANFPTTPGAYATSGNKTTNGGICTGAAAYQQPCTDVSC